MYGMKWPEEITPGVTKAYNYKQAQCPIDNDCVYTLHSHPWISILIMIVSEEIEENISGRVMELTGSPESCTYVYNIKGL